MDKERPIPPGIEAEQTLLYLAREAGLYYTYSVALDLYHATDAVATGLVRLKRRLPAAAVQLTTQRHANGKAKRFVEKAAEKFSGPLLYVRMAGRVTPEMAEAFIEALVALWTDPSKKKRRAHGVTVGPDGSLHWFGLSTQP